MTRIRNPLSDFLIRVFDKQGEQVGGGVLVDEVHCITCAHVVNSAHGQSKESQAWPQEPVYIDFPLISPEERKEAKVVHWTPPSDLGGDIAVIRLNKPKPRGAERAHMIERLEHQRLDFLSMGFPEGLKAGVTAEGVILYDQAQGYFQLEAKSEYKILPGFSGSPVWSEKAQGVVGIVVEAESNIHIKAGWMIPTSLILEEWIPIPHQEPLQQKHIEIMFIFAVAKSSEFHAIVPEGVDKYDSIKQTCWTPFKGEVDDQINILAQKMAIEEQFFSSGIYLNADVSGLAPPINPRDPNSDRCIYIILVDPWTLSIKKYSSLITSYDTSFSEYRRLFMVDSCESDRTEKYIKKTFTHKYHRGSVDLNPRRICNPTDFEEKIKCAINEIRALIVDNTPPKRPVKGEDAPVTLGQDSHGSDEDYSSKEAKRRTVDSAYNRLPSISN